MSAVLYGSHSISPGAISDYPLSDSEAVSDYSLSDSVESGSGDVDLEESMSDQPVPPDTSRLAVRASGMKVLKE